MPNNERDRIEHPPTVSSKPGEPLRQDQPQGRGDDWIDSVFPHGGSGRLPFERSLLDKYRESFPHDPSLMDEVRAVIQQYAKRNSLRLCRRGKQVVGPDGRSYRTACGNKWSCPLCSPSLLAADRSRLEQKLATARSVLYLTFTVAHDDSSRRAGSLAPILETWATAFTSGSWMGTFRDRTGLIGRVRSIEVTFPEQGFHPHIHAVFLFNSKPLEERKAALIQRWLYAAGRCGHKAAYEAQRGRYAGSATDRSKVAFYLCEQTAIRQSRGGKGRTPGDLLHNVAATGDADDLNALLGFHEAVAGKQKISASRSFWSL